MLLSNIPGYIKPAKFYGGDVTKIIGIGVGLGNLATAIMSVSTVEII